MSAWWFTETTGRTWVQLICGYGPVQYVWLIEFTEGHSS